MDQRNRHPQKYHILYCRSGNLPNNSGNRPLLRRYIKTARWTFRVYRSQPLAPSVPAWHRQISAAPCKTPLQQKRVPDILNETPAVEEIAGKKDIAFGGASVKHVTFSYGAEMILDDVSLQIPKGLVIGIVGRSGSGKCPFMETKIFCSNCRVHCYKLKMRERIRVVMRFSRPRMFFHHPIAA